MISPLKPIFSFDFALLTNYYDDILRCESKSFSFFSSNNSYFPNNHILQYFWLFLMFQPDCFIRITYLSTV